MKVTISTVIGLLLIAFGWMSPAVAVMPPEHYVNAVAVSEIKAVARIIRVKVLETTDRSTLKSVEFRLVHGFEPDIPGVFQGHCYSVDWDTQDPGVGGRIYYYPSEGSEVLVTVSRNQGQITSMTPMNRELEQLIHISGLSQIRFLMGKATPMPEDASTWFLFQLNGRATGFLAALRLDDQEDSSDQGFSHDFMVAPPEENRLMFRTKTMTRPDQDTTLNRLSVQIIPIETGKTLSGPVRNFSFKTEPSTSMSDGILARNRDNFQDISIPENTVTDFLLFALVEQYPFDPKFSMSLNLVETLELHLKTGIDIQYKGRDSNMDDLHRFVQEGKSQGMYWVDDQHRLVRVQWDDDKTFVRQPRQKILDILVP